jgi:hypothetical protein
MIQNLAAFSPPQDRVNLLRWEIVSQYPDQVRETGEAGRSIGVAPLPRGQFEHMRGTRCRWPFADAYHDAVALHRGDLDSNRAPRETKFGKSLAPQQAASAFRGFFPVR